MVRRILVACCVLVMLSSPAVATTRLKNICRIKGQEENVLRGYGLVVGLNQTGEVNDGPTMRALARSMELMGAPLAIDGQQVSLDDLKKLKNAAYVIVTAKVPATGARRGDKVDCFVAAINGKSLEGGRLAFAALQGPNTKDPRVYALCEGQVTIDNAAQPMVGVIHDGCQMEADLLTPFYLDGCITLVLDKNHADFQIATEIVYSIKQKGLFEPSEIKESEVVQAINASNIVVKIPKRFMNDPVGFASELLETRLEEPQTESRVVINPRAGTIVISGDVEIGDVIVSHKNVVVEAEAPALASIDVDDSSGPKLQVLVNQLNSLKVPTSDMIEIIKGIERNGKLHGRLIIE
jgi:flagellar P-ring protein FlgI